MTTPRSSQIDLNSTPYYHCISRCVRRSYLCGYSVETQKDFSHRKQWILDRIKHLASVFYIDLCAYAIMSNHYHLVLHVNRRDAKDAQLDELLFRWYLIFPTDAEKLKKSIESAISNRSELIEAITARLQERLSDISWYMRCLNEVIAKMANKEDNCKGRFWEGRFKSQALLDEGAILSAMVYVDLNPIRARLSETPETSDFTSIQERIRCYVNPSKNGQPKKLMPFYSSSLKTKSNTINYSLEDYLNLVDATGRLIKEDKRGAISKELPPLIERLQLSSQGWLDMVKGIENNFYYAVGHAVHLKEFVPGLFYRNSKCITFSEKCYLDLVA